MARAGVARAWKEQEELKRRMKGLPDPKLIDVSPEGLAKLAKKARARSRRQIEVSGVESFDPQPANPLTHRTRPTPGSVGDYITAYHRHDLRHAAMSADRRAFFFQSHDGYMTAKEAKSGLFPHRQTPFPTGFKAIADKLRVGFPH
jgi:hypothetical protein